MGRGAHISDLVKAAREPDNRFAAAWVSLCSGLAALASGAWVWGRTSFVYRDDSGVFGRIAADRYPKQQELLAYGGAFVCVIAGILLGWLAWLLFAALYRRLRGAGTACCLRRSALACTGLLLACFPLFLARHGYAQLACSAAALMLPFAAVLAFGKSAALERASRFFLAPAASPRSAEAPETKLPRKRLQRVFIWGAVPIALYLYLYDGSVLNGALDLFHEGELLACLNGLAHGDLPYRDIYLQHGLYNIAKPSLLLAFGTPSVASLRLLDSLVQPLVFLALYALGLLVLRSWISAVALVMFASGACFTHMASIHMGIDRNLPALLGLAVMAYGIRKSYPAPGAPAQQSRFLPWFAAAGALTAAAFLYSTESGLYLLASGTAFFTLCAITRPAQAASARLCPLAAYLGGALASLAPAALVLQALGILDDMARNTYIQCAYQTAAWGLPFPSLAAALRNAASPSGAQAALQAFPWYLPVCIYLAAAGALTSRILLGSFWRSPTLPMLLPVLLFGMAQMRTVLGRSDEPHLYFATLPAWLLIVYYLERAVPAAFASKGTQAAGRWAALILAALAVFYPASGMLRSQAAHAIKVLKGKTIPRFHDSGWPAIGIVEIGAKQQDGLRRVVDFIQRETAPAKRIFDFSNQGAYYFLADRPSATRYFQSAYAVTPALQLQVIDDLIRADVRLVIFKSGGWWDSPDGIPSAVRYPLLAQYIAARYEKKINIDSTVLLLRR